MDKPLRGLLTVPLAITALITGLGGLKVLIDIYQMSIIVGIALTVLSIPLVLIFFGTTVCYFSIAYLWGRETEINRWEYWAKNIATSIFGTILAWAAYVAGNWIILYIADWLAN